MFQTSTPVTGDGFDNREEELAALGRAFEQLAAGAPQWVTILGPRKIGKTSLVLEAARRAQGATLRVIAMDVQEWAPVSPEFFRRMALRVLDATLGRELGESLERLSRQPSVYRSALQHAKRFGDLPASLRVEILELPEGDATPDQIGAWLGLPQQLAEALDLRLVVAMDEFQELARLAAPRKGFDPFALMRSVWQKHDRVAYVISGSARSMLLALVNTEQSPFFHHFTILELGPFGREAAVALLKQHGPPEHPIPSAVAERAVSTIGGQPFYLQMLGEELTARPRAPTLADLKAALQRLLFSATGRLSLFLENEYDRLVGRSTCLAATLDALAEGPCTVTGVAARIKAPTGATVRYLDRLKDAVRRIEDGRYGLSDPTFALWLRWRRPGGAVVPMSVVGDEAEQAVARSLAAVGFDLVYQSKSSRGAFDLLATRGAVQLGVQVKRSALPLRFTRAEWSRMVAEAERFGWRWVLAAVGTDETVVILDPGKATRGREERVGAEAEISNLLQWVDRAIPRRGRR